MVYRLSIILLVLSLSVSLAAPNQSKGKKFNIAFFQAGEHIGHSGMRAAFRDNLETMLPDSLSAVFISSGFFSGDWNQDSCKVLAKVIASRPDIDIVVTLGPWVIEDLLEIGYKKPIIGLYRNDPELEGLLSPLGKPKATNLTVDTRIYQYENDLRILTSLVKVKTLGVLCFPSNDENNKIVSKIDSLGKQMGFETVTASGKNNKGTFAFYNAYSALPKKIDALYLMSAWDMGGDKLKVFLDKCISDGIAVFSTEGWLAVERGALISERDISPYSEGWFAAQKALRIMEGAIPADLPTEIHDLPTLMINENTARLLKLDIPEGALVEANTVPAKPAEGVDQYNLDYVIRKALNQNPGYIATQEAISRVDASAKQSKSAYLPNVSASVTAFHVDDNSVYNDRGETKNDQISAGLNLEQTILSMVTIKNIQKGTLLKQQAELENTTSALELEYETSLAFFNCLKTQEMVDVYNRYRRIIDYRLHMANIWKTESEESKREFSRLSIERLEATRRLYEARSEARNAKIMLNTLLNQNWNTSFDILPTGFSQKDFFSESYVTFQALNTSEGRFKVREYFLDEAMKQNSELLSTRKKIELQNHALKINKARLFPELKFRASLNYVDRQQNAPPPFVEKNNTWAFGGELQLPLYLGGERHYEKASLKAGLNELEYLRDDVSLHIMNNVTTDIDFLFAQQGKLASAQRETDFLNTQMESMTKPSLEKASYLEFLDMAKAVLDNDLSSINARYAFFECSAHLCREIGWSPIAENVSPSRLIAQRIANVMSGKK